VEDVQAMKRYDVYLSIAVCFGALIAASRPAAMAQQRHGPDKVQAVRTLVGTCVGFEIDDYPYALIRKQDGTSLTLSFNKPGMEFFLAAHKGRPLTITYQVVETYIPESAGRGVMERITTAKAGDVTYESWWRQTSKSMTNAQLIQKYGDLIFGPSSPVAAPLPFYYGKWKVIGYKALPVSAMSETGARSWLGRIGVYGPNSARFHETECEKTSYLPRTVSVVDFVRDYRCKPADLGIPSGTVEIIEVESAGHPFANPGGVLIKRADGKMLMLWDGVFFILQKQ
jgi:hypothetical protein